jgi:hypothetical protein
MGLTRIELIGTVVKPPRLGATPSGRAVLRLSVDAGEGPEHLLLELVFVNEAARDLARRLIVGRRIRASGTLRPVRRSAIEIAGRQQIEVVVGEISIEGLVESAEETDLTRKVN